MRTKALKRLSIPLKSADGSVVAMSNIGEAAGSTLVRATEDLRRGACLQSLGKIGNLLFMSGAFVFKHDRGELSDRR